MEKAPFITMKEGVGADGVANQVHSIYGNTTSTVLPTAPPRSSSPGRATGPRARVAV